MTGVWVVLGVVGLSLVVGVVMRRRDGRFRPAPTIRRQESSHAAVGTPTPGGSAEHASGAGPSDPASPQAGRAASEGAVPGADGRPVKSAEPAGSGGSVGGADGGLGREVAALGAELGERGTLLQFSTAFCAPCRATRRVLAGVAEAVPGVRHVEVDAEAHLGLVRQLGVRRTPTVLVLDAAGREVRRASGAPPSRDAVFAALAQIADGPLPPSSTRGSNRADDDSSEPSPTL